MLQATLEQRSKSDKQDRSELLNTFFVTQPWKILSTILTSASVVSPQCNALSSVSVQFQIPAITTDQIKKLLQCMPCHKATGLDGIGARVLKVAAPSISSSLARLINHCIETGEFPSKWKSVKVTPIYKGCGSKEDMNNYRPISVLSLLSKLMGKHVHHSLYSYLTEKKFLHQLQSGSRKWHSTQTALIRVVDQLLVDLDQNNVNGLIFIDYKKAFDLIDHNILIAKLKSLGINSREIAFFTSYLKNRTQVVDTEGHRSTLKTITNGVPQGSVLGSLLFIVFINDLPKAITRSVVDIYADDTTISVSAAWESAPTAIQDQLQEDMDEVVKWTYDIKWF